jgi:hypothetical protein
MVRKLFRDPDDAKLREDMAETVFRTLQEAMGSASRPCPALRRAGREEPLGGEARQEGREGAEHQTVGGGAPVNRP